MTIVLGVIADTHIPDRARNLDQRIIPIFEQRGVQAILHAGDVSTPAVLNQLEKVAPVHAVRGNRDWVMLRHLPPAISLDYGGTRLVLTHGHGPLWNYVFDRFYYITYGYHLERFRPRLQSTFPKARIIVFGHTHKPLNLWSKGQLLFNPGSAHFPDAKNLAPSIGLLRLNAEGEIKSEIIFLDL